MSAKLPIESPGYWAKHFALIWSTDPQSFSSPLFDLYRSNNSTPLTIPASNSVRFTYSDHLICSNKREPLEPYVFDSQVVITDLDFSNQTINDSVGT